MKVKLLKKWEHGDETYRKGQVLDIEDADAAQQLIDQGYAEAVDKPTPSSIAKDALDKKEKDKDDKGKQTDAAADAEKAESLVNSMIEIARAAAEKAVADAAKPAERDRKGVAIMVVEDEYDKRFADAKGGFRSFSEFAFDIYSHSTSEGRKMSDRLKGWDVGANRHKDILGTDDASGGFLIPTEFQANIQRTRLENSIVRNNGATIIPMSTNKLDWPAVSDTDHSTGNPVTFFGGIKVYKPGEANAITNAEPKFDMISLELKELKALMYVTNEIMEDSPISLEPVLNELVGQAIAFVEDNEYINGVGGGNAQGIINAPAKIQATYDLDRSVMIAEMWSRLYPPSHATAVWLVAHDEWPSIITSEGATGAVRTIITGLASGVGGGPPVPMIYGRPVIMSEKLPKTGDADCMMLVDFRHYLLGQKNNGALQTSSSMHFRFDRNEVAFRVVLRYEGKSWWKSSLTPANGGTTVSPIVGRGSGT